MKNIAVFASGDGTNAENIIRYFNHIEGIRVSLVVSNNKDALVLKRADKHHVPIHITNRNEFYETKKILTLMGEHSIGLIALAGFMWLIPRYLIIAFPDKIINIHPALLPAFGGKGMYGDRVHKQVIASGAKESGITIHYVNEKYDQGAVIFQEKCKIDENETPESLAAKVHRLEYENYPVWIKKVIEG